MHRAFVGSNGIIFRDEGLLERSLKCVCFQATRFQSNEIVMFHNLLLSSRICFIKSTPCFNTCSVSTGFRSNFECSTALSSWSCNIYLLMIHIYIYIYIYRWHYSLCFRGLETVFAKLATQNSQVSSNSSISICISICSNSSRSKSSNS